MNGTPRAYRGSPSARMPRPMKIARLMSPPPNAKRTAPLPIVGLHLQGDAEDNDKDEEGGEHERERDLPRERHLPRPCRLSPAEREVDVWPAPAAAHVTAGNDDEEPADRRGDEKHPWTKDERSEEHEEQVRKDRCDEQGQDSTVGGVRALRQCLPRWFCTRAWVERDSGGRVLASHVSITPGERERRGCRPPPQDAADRQAPSPDPIPTGDD